MLKDWYNSSLQKIVPSENKGAKFYGKVAKEKNKKDYTIKESFEDQSLPRSHMSENLWTNCSSVIPRLGLGVWREMSFHSQTAVSRLLLRRIHS